MNDDQRAAYVAGLVNERKGYEVRLEGAKANKADGEVARLEGRIESVDAELEKVRDSAKAPAKRAAKQA